LPGMPHQAGAGFPRCGDRPSHALAGRGTALLSDEMGRVKLSVPTFVTPSGSSRPLAGSANRRVERSCGGQVLITSPRTDVVVPIKHQGLGRQTERQGTARFTTNSNRTWVVRLNAQPVTPDSRPLGASATFTIRLTQYGIVGRLILGAGVALLIAAGNYRPVRAHRRAKTTDPRCVPA